MHTNTLNQIYPKALFLDQYFQLIGDNINSAEIKTDINLLINSMNQSLEKDIGKVSLGYNP